MNCDQAFDAITDPIQAQDRELAHHLRNCPRCRQMYETLEPALGLFASAESDPARIPTRVASPSIRLARQIASRLSGTGRARRPAPRRRALAGALLAAGVAGFLMSVGLGIWSPTPTPTPENPGPVRSCLWLERDAVPSQPAGTIVVACVQCHLDHAAAPEHQQSEFRVFSEELERLMNRRSRPLADPMAEQALIAAVSVRTAGHA